MKALFNAMKYIAPIPLLGFITYGALVTFEVTQWTWAIAAPLFIAAATAMTVLYASYIIAVKKGEMSE